VVDAFQQRIAKVAPDRDDKLRALARHRGFDA